MDDFKVVRATASESVMWRNASAFFAHLATAWSASTFRDVLTMFAIASWPMGDRVRYGAFTIAVALIVNVILLSMVSAYASPGVPRAAMAIGALFAAAVAWQPESFATAWPASIPGRIAAALRKLFYKPAE